MRDIARRSPTVLVTGATGLLGRHVLRVGDADSWQVIAPGHTSMDVCSRDAVLDTITGWRPDAVVHLAYRRDDRRTIVDGSDHVAEAAAACGARLVHLSTDVVFGGRERPYREDDPVDPRHGYGRWKAEAETLVLARAPQSVVVRTSLIVGTEGAGRDGAVVHDVERALRGEPFTFFDDEVRCPVHAADLATAVVALVRRREVHGVLHVAGPEAMTRADLARRVAVWLGGDPTRLTTGPMGPLAATRPARVVLDSSRAAGLGITCRPPGAWLG